MNFTADQYTTDILNGTIPASKWTILACQRHVDDLKHGHKRGLFFDETQAKLAVAFFPTLLRHSKGKQFVGKPVFLEPWQQFKIWVIYGWMIYDDTTPDGYRRRFRSAYVSVARKNGKSTIASGIGLKMLIADGESGAEVYTAATKKDQAKIIHGEAIRMVKQSPQLKKELKIYVNNISSEKTFSKFEPLGADSNTLDGLNISCALIDELHKHRDGSVYNVLDTGTGTRIQPLIFAITTAGNDVSSFCYTQETYAQQLLEGTVEDDSHFAIIYTLDQGDDWRDEANWIKANPNLGISKRLSDMRALAKKAQHMPGQRVTFIQLHLNVWTQSVDRHYDIEKWVISGNNIVEEHRLYDRRCFGGLDLANTSDYNCWMLLFAPLPPLEREHPLDHLWVCLPRFFLPEDTVADREVKGQTQIRAWVEDGLLYETPGSVTDYDFIYAKIIEDTNLFNIEQIGFDPWNATQLVNKLEQIGESFMPDHVSPDDWSWCVQIRQGHGSLSAPTQWLDRLYLSSRLAHGNHPILNWMIANVVMRYDENNNYIPGKKRSLEKIDGVSALNNALYVADKHIDDDDEENPYDDEDSDGLFVL